MNKSILNLRVLFGLILIYSGFFDLQGQEYRSYSGVLNSIGSFWGSAYDTVVQIADLAFEDNISVPSGSARPNPRMISNMLFSQHELTNDPLGLSAYAWGWGQFIDHDITLSPNHHSEAFPIQIPVGDIYFDPTAVGNVTMPMMRSAYLPKTGTNLQNPRRYFNQTTAFIDGSGIYGDNEERAIWLRTLNGGRLKVSEGNLLPFNTVDGKYGSEIDINAPFMDMPFPQVTKWFVAGDPRANENPLLTSIHTIFLREHNRICAEIEEKEPAWNDEKIFQEARKRVGAQIQAIVFEEWLPALGIDLPNYSGYDSKTNPGITNVFTTAAYRYGHSTITSDFFLMDDDANELDVMSLKSCFFNPLTIDYVGGIEPLLIGSAFLIEQDLDCKVIDDLRNFLFGEPGHGGLDLVSLNINRGRDRGLPGYNKVRIAYGLEPHNSFESITANPLIHNVLRDLYGSIDDIDPWVGMLAEDHMPGSIFGPTAQNIIAYQFDHIREGDRFYYEAENMFAQEIISEIKTTTLAEIIRKNTGITVIHNDIFKVMSKQILVNRTIDGTNNNPYNPNWGSVGEKVVIETPLEYGDGVFSPGGLDRPNPREISNDIFAQEGEIGDPLNLSAYTWGWGQFIDHDITLSPELHDEAISFDIPVFDPFFDPQGTGSQTMSIRRSAYHKNTGHNKANPRIPINAITAYIDGSAVYGSDTLRAKWLRTGNNGKLKTSAGDLLPFNTITGELSSVIDENAPNMAMPFSHVVKYFIAGDVRANENPFLTTIHTLFVREHNRQCEKIVRENPDWSDEEVYQYARKIVGGKIEAIVYEEWLPTLGVELPEYKGYDPLVQPGIMNVFSTAAYRYGHSTIGGELMRLDENGDVIPEGNISLRDAFFNPNAIVGLDGIEPYLQGMATVVEQNFDCHVVDDLRNFLFGSPGAGGLDLVAMNIFRGRERGLADYNTIRTRYGRTPIQSFDDLSEDPVLNQHFASVYHDVDQIDPWAGFLAEDHMHQALFGPTAMHIISKQFLSLRDGDYFYYENDPVLKEAEISEIKATRLSELIKDNSSVSEIQDEIFRVFSTTSVRQDFLIYERLEVYPNPAQDFINIKLPAMDNEFNNFNLEIYSVAGQSVLKMSNQRYLPNQTIKVSLGKELIAGLYLIKIYGKEKVMRTKFLINK